MACGLMAKAMLVTLPVLLLLLDFWPLGRLEHPFSYLPDRGSALPGVSWRRAVAEKVPLALLSAVFLVITFGAQAREGAVKSLEMFPPVTRLANAAVSGATYLVMMVWPRGLAVYYPHRGGDLEVWKVALSTILLLAVTAAVVSQARRRPYLATGWFWYLVVLVPVSGLVQLGMQAMADRYTYVSLVGIFIILAWGGWELAEQRPLGRPALGTTAVLLLVVLAVFTRVQLGYWRNSTVLFRHAIDVTSKNFLAHEHLAGALYDKGEFEGAAHHYSKALETTPLKAEGYYNLGNTLLAMGRLSEAVSTYHLALREHPAFPKVLFNIGAALVLQKRPGEAVPYLREAVRINPDMAEGHYNLGTLLLESGDFEGALFHLQEALRSKPGFEDAAANLDAARRLAEKRRQQQ